MSWTAVAILPDPLFAFAVLILPPLLKTLKAILMGHFEGLKVILLLSELFVLPEEEWEVKWYVDSTFLLPCGDLNLRGTAAN